jgi:pathogenesis-related protein 1
VRPFLILLIVATYSSAQAQYPRGYAPYNPGYQPYPPSYAPRPPNYPLYGSPYAPPAPGGSRSSLTRGMLDAQNAVRARVGVPPLVWSPQLAAVAQDWAKRLIATRGFAHRPNNRYGENLYAISGAAASPAQVVASWADEARGYDVRSNTCAGICGHYTQIVWRTSRAVGCAIATDPEREVWVCNYDPPGNYVGIRPY